MPPALTGQPFTLTQTDVGSFWVPANDGVIRPFLQRRGTWEPSIGNLLGRLIRRGSRFLDVGAGIGYFTVLGAGVADGVRIDAVEPNPDTVELLRFNLWLNGVQASVWPVAVADERRAIPLSVATSNFGDTRGVDSVSGDAYSLVVAALRADDLFPGRTFDVVKIDVQGWEIEVLLGMQRILRESPEIAVVVEFWPSAIRQRHKDPLHILTAYRKMGLGYVVVRDDTLTDMKDAAIVAMCDSAGAEGSLNLLLRHA